MNILTLLFDVFTFWVCLGTLVFFILSVTELFTAHSFYSQSHRFSFIEGLVVIPVTVLLWPVSLACVFDNVHRVRRDARIRHTLYVDQKRQDLHKRACEFMIARASNVAAKSISVGTVTADHLFERTTKLNAKSISAGTVTADHLFERTTKLNR
ncbi:PhoH [Vibrio phage vB_VpaS_1601]|uniref:PhoH n=1 Tax=Vibrio phage SHOU24 TaxID=1414739 RepID=UPI0003ED246F|nr:PhoH [Vibrio phage SHOU24]AHI61199.1 PhoH [Vibrio phage SHOU24]WHM52772.1 PhoH [Vibrio phage vB_VpaP_1601]